MEQGEMWFQLQMALKRLMDIVVSAVALLILSPVILVIVILVKLDSPGEAFFRHKRIGKNGREFNLYKFRSMRKGGDDSGYMNYLRDLIQSERNGSSKGLPYAKMADDARVTRIGRFIRNYYLDEIPQLFNVLKGEMSLVGPRPHVRFEVANYTPAQHRRLSVKPGATGIWQVEGKADCTFTELIDLDLDYIDHWSLWLDIQIMFKTLMLIFKGGEGFWARKQKAVPAPVHKLPVAKPYDQTAVRPMGGGLMPIAVPITGNKTEDCADPSKAASSEHPEPVSAALSSQEKPGSDGTLS